jgi:hypothetical protein
MRDIQSEAAKHPWGRREALQTTRFWNASALTLDNSSHHGGCSVPDLNRMRKTVPRTSLNPALQAYTISNAEAIPRPNTPTEFRSTEVVAPFGATAGLTANNRTVELIKASFVDLLWEGNEVCAIVGKNLQAGIGGFGPTLAAALRDLAENIEKDERISIWVPQRVIPYRDDGVLKVDCPECGHAQVIPEFTDALIIDCESCQEDIRVLPLADDD